MLALTLSMTILFLITSSYQKSIEVNGYWADWIHDLALLTEAASHVNSPGNEAFRADEGDTDADARVKMERTKLEKAIAEFDRRRLELEADLDARADRSTGDEIAVSLAGVTEPMKHMVAASDAIFDHLLDGDVGEAGKRMAHMDAQYGQVLGRLRDTSELAAGIQQANLESQLEFASRLQLAEIAFAAVILFTVGMVTVYGRQLAQRMRDFQSELTLYHDHLEALVDERTEELEESLERLRLTDRLASIGSLAAGLGHDMNNVLFPVRCWLDALGEADLDESSQAELASIRQSVEYLQQLSDGLRLLALDPEQDGAEPGATDLQAWWDDVRPLFLSALPKEATLEGEIAILLPPVGLARHQLTQAVFNLVVNAGAAIADGGTVRVLGAPGRRGADRLDQRHRRRPRDDGGRTPPGARSVLHDQEARTLDGTGPRSRARGREGGRRPRRDRLGAGPWHDRHAVASARRAGGGGAGGRRALGDRLDPRSSGRDVRRRAAAVGGIRGDRGRGGGGARRFALGHRRGTAPWSRSRRSSAARGIGT